jgi:hypothetical protein
MNIASPPRFRYRSARQERRFVMPSPRFGSGSLQDAQAAAFLDDLRSLEPEEHDVTVVNTDQSGLLAALDDDQLEREIAAIERASADLRRADPALQSWSDAPAVTLHEPRPIWLLIGVLWLSTALATLGAVFAISALVG